MSATLGPIHLIMHERLRLVAERQESLAAFARERMSPGQREELAANWIHRFELPAGELADLIGEAPIHGWLQRTLESLLLSEANLWAILADRPERAAGTWEHVREHGRQTAARLQEEMGAWTDARQLLQAIERALLTSLPCDRVSEVLAAGERAFIVRRDLLFHEALWRHAGLTEELALAGHEAWLRGFCSSCPGARLARAEVSVDGRRLFDDRLSLQAAEALHGA